MEYTPVRLSTTKRANPLRKLAIAGAAGAVAFLLNSTHAADVSPGWGSWWLPPNRSAHGGSIDTLFLWIFWLTMVVWILVTVVMVYFMIKYRHNPNRKKAHFTHGNSRLELCWTIAPAIILAVIALASKKVWDEYRYSPGADDPDRAIVLVIGQQFKWNAIYPGPDKKLGAYLKYPKPSDAFWPNPNRDGKPYTFQGTKGPADLPFDKAIIAINTYIDQVNPLGKDFTDPAGIDDDWQSALARPIILPVNRNIEIQLSSKDVLHDFFLPNFRVKLDAVPGMRGHIYFKATMTSKQREEQSRRRYKLDEVVEMLKQPENSELTIAISETDKPAGAEFDARAKQWLFKDKDAKKTTIIRDAKPLTPAVVDKLKGIGVTEIEAYLPGYWDLACAELCGQGHSTMQGQVIIVSDEEYRAKFETPAGAPKVATNDGN